MKDSVLFELVNKYGQFVTTRAQGAGGQHVNKTDSAVQLKLDIRLLPLSEEAKLLIYEKLTHRIVQEHYLYVRSEQERDQKTNKDVATKILARLIEKALIVPKARKKTKPKKSAIQKRLNSKSLRSEVKKNRRKFSVD